MNAALVVHYGGLEKSQDLAIDVGSRPRMVGGAKSAATVIVAADGCLAYLVSVL